MLLIAPRFELGMAYEILMAEVEKSWNFTQQNNCVLRYFNRSKTKPHVLGELQEEE